MKRVLQTVLVKKTAAPTLKEAKKLAAQHADRIYTSRETKNTWRFRQRPPGCFTEGPNTYTTVCIRGGKVCLVYGRLKKGAKARKACR